MDKEEFKQLLREQTETLMGGMERLNTETLDALARTKLDLIDKISDEVRLSEQRLTAKLASKEEVRDHERRIVQLEQAVS